MDTKRELLISKGWIQAVALVGLCGFLLLGILAYRTYTDEPPIPSKVTGTNGQLLFTGEDVSAGQEVLLKNAHGVRLNLRPWRVSRTGLHRRLSPSRRADCQRPKCCLLLPLLFLAVWSANMREFADGSSKDGPGFALRALNTWTSAESFRCCLPSVWPFGQSSFSADFAAASAPNPWATCPGCFSFRLSLAN